MAPKIDPKSMKNRGCVADAFLERFWPAMGRQKSERQIIPRTHLGINFDQKSENDISKGI